MNEQENQLLEDIVDDSDASSAGDMKYQVNQLLDDVVNEHESDAPPPPQTEFFEISDQVQDQEGSVESNQIAHHVVTSQQSLELKSQYESDEVEVDDTSDHLNPAETETDILSWQEEIVEAEDNMTNTESISSLNANSVDNQDEWLYQETVQDGWYDNHQSVVTTEAFYTHDDDNNNRHELQQLMSRYFTNKSP